MTKAANNRSSIYKGKDGSWHGWVSFGEGSDGRCRRKHVRGQTKREVAEKVQRLERQRAGGYLGDRPLTVNEWLEVWIGIRVIAGARTKTVEGYRTDQRHIDRAIGEILLNRLNAEHIDRLWISIMTARAGAATCAHARRTLSAALNAAVDRGHMAKNPVSLSQSPRYEAPEIEPFSKVEARRVLDVAAGRRNSARWSVALALGLRQGEALGLRWSDVNIDEARLLIRVQLFLPPWQHGCLNPEGQPTCHKDPGRCPARFGGQPILVPVKSRAGRRALSLPGSLVEQLRRQSASQAAERLRVGSRWQNQGLVFAREDGSPIRKETDSAEWHRILRLADVRQGRLHDARHTAATLLMVQGVPPGIAMRLLGHSDTRMTARYQHVIEEAAKVAADQVGEALWGSRSAGSWTN
jgi:integrase